MRPGSISPALFQTFSRFALIGGGGFLVDAGLLLMMLEAGAGAYLARIISIGCAMLVTWRLNRALTFGASDDGQLREAVRYAGIALSVAALNYGIYAGLILFIPVCPPLLATAIATAICMLISFAGYRSFAFRQA